MRALQLAARNSSIFLGDIEPMILQLEIACLEKTVPAQSQFELWCSHALNAVAATRREVNIRIVDHDEMTGLNHSYRNQQKSTNVLSFPFEPIEGIEMDLLGDIAICAAVVSDEALQQGKSLEAHWAHMVIHGILHLCGYDHIAEKDAIEMETLEVNIMSALGYPDPYNDHV